MAFTPPPEAARESRRSLPNNLGLKVVDYNMPAGKTP